MVLFLCGAAPAAHSCMLVSLLCVLLLMVASLSAVPHRHSKASQGVGLSCEEEFRLHSFSCYRYFSTGWGYHQASKLCSRHHASLVSLLAAEEEEFVVQLAENNSAFWIGLNDEEGPAAFHKEGVFKWSDGQDFDERESYQNWKRGQPDNRRHLDCVQVTVDGWAMALGGCGGSKLPFICKKPACPSGLQWSGSDCDIIDGSSPVSNSWLPAHTATVGCIATLLLVLVLALACSRARLYSPATLTKFPT